jgi:hypothetical protein
LNKPVFVIFDAPDQGAYAIMRAWYDAGDLTYPLTDARDLDLGRNNVPAAAMETLAERIKDARAVVLLVGDGVADPPREIQWQLDLVKEHDVPMVCINLNNRRKHDHKRLPRTVLRLCALHVSPHAKIVQLALDKWPEEYRTMGPDELKTQRAYGDAVYRRFYL